MKFYFLLLGLASAELVYNNASEPIKCTCSLYDSETGQECLDFGFDFVNGFVNDFAQAGFQIDDSTLVSHWLTLSQPWFERPRAPSSRHWFENRSKDFVNDQFCNAVKSEIPSCGFFVWIPEYINESGCSIVCNATCGWAADFILQIKAFGIVRIIFILLGILIFVHICKKCCSLCCKANKQRSSDESEYLNNSPVWINQLTLTVGHSYGLDYVTFFVWYAWTQICDIDLQLLKIFNCWQIFSCWRLQHANSASILNKRIPIV